MDKLRLKKLAGLSEAAKHSESYYIQLAEKLREIASGTQYDETAIREAESVVDEMLNKIRAYKITLNKVKQGSFSKSGDEGFGLQDLAIDIVKMFAARK